MSQEKILEKNKYKDKEWLEYHYIKKNKTLLEISKEFGYSKTTLSRWKDRFELKKYSSKKKKENYSEEKWLREEFLIKNKTIVQIAEESSVNRGTIQEYINRFKLKKDPESKKEAYSKRIRETSLKKYNVNHFNSSEEILQKRIQTNLKKYNHPTYLGSSSHKKDFEDSDKFNFVFGKTLHEWGKLYNINNIILYRMLLKKPDISYDEFISFLDGYDKSLSDIEVKISSLLNVPLYNKYFDLKEFPNLKYKPDFKLDQYTAINVDGLYWHSQKIKDDKYYHFNLRKDFEKNNLRIFQFRADEVLCKSKIILSMINNYHKKSGRIFGRKCEVKIVNQGDANIFLNNSHLMGTIKAKHVGLYYKDELIMLLSYKKYGKVLKIERLASKVNFVVVGGFGRLFKKTLSLVDKVTEVHYWVDLRYGTGFFLEKFKFKLERETLGWKWTDFKNTYNRLKCRANMDERKLSQAEHAEELGWYKIYDAGQRLWVLKIGEEYE